MKKIYCWTPLQFPSKENYKNVFCLRNNVVGSFQFQTTIITMYSSVISGVIRTGIQALTGPKMKNWHIGYNPNKIIQLRFSIRAIIMTFSTTLLVTFLTTFLTTSREFVVKQEATKRTTTDPTERLNRVIIYTSFIIPHSSFLIPHSSFLITIPHSSLLFIIHYSSFIHTSLKFWHFFSH